MTIEQQRDAIRDCAKRVLWGRFFGVASAIELSDALADAILAAGFRCVEPLITSEPKENAR